MSFSSFFVQSVRNPGNDKRTQTRHQACPSSRSVAACSRNSDANSALRDSANSGCHPATRSSPHRALVRLLEWDFVQVAGDWVGRIVRVNDIAECREIRFERLSRKVLLANRSLVESSFPGCIASLHDCTTWIFVWQGGQLDSVFDARKAIEFTVASRKSSGVSARI